MNTKPFKAANAVTQENLSANALQTQLMQAFSAPQYSAIISVDGIDANTGRPFHHDFIFNQNDPEFRAMLNDYGARLAAEKLFSGIKWVHPAE